MAYPCRGNSSATRLLVLVPLLEAAANPRRDNCLLFFQGVAPYDISSFTTGLPKSSTAWLFLLSSPLHGRGDNHLHFFRGTAILWPCTKIVAEFAKGKPPKIVCFARTKLERNIVCATLKPNCGVLQRIYLCVIHKKNLKKLIFVIVKLIFVVVRTIYIFYDYFQFN